jgi:hypothetical protein
VASLIAASGVLPSCVVELFYFCGREGSVVDANVVNFSIEIFRIAATTFAADVGAGI